LKIPEHELSYEPTEYYEDRFGNKIYRDENEDYHNTTGPALITTISESWYKHGKLHNVHGPAVEKTNGHKEYWIEGERVTEEEFDYCEFPTIEQPQIDEFGTEIWRNKDGQVHRDDDLPAMTYSNGNKYFYKDGKLHRLNGPAIIYQEDILVAEYWINGVQLTEDEFNESKDWEKFEPEIDEGNFDEEVLYETNDLGTKTYRNEIGQVHREDGPAIIMENGESRYYLEGKALTEKEYYKIERIDEDGNKRWFNKDGKLHRDNYLPAVEMTNGHKAWYINGVRHRGNGPAVEYANGSVKWYMNGINLEDEEVKEILNDKVKSPESKMREYLDLQYNPDEIRRDVKAIHGTEEPDFKDEIMKRVEKLKGPLAKEIEEVITETLFK